MSKKAKIDFEDTITAEIEIEAIFEEGEGEENDLEINCIYTSVPDEDVIEQRLIGY